MQPVGRPFPETNWRRSGVDFVEILLSQRYAWTWIHLYVLERERFLGGYVSTRSWMAVSDHLWWKVWRRDWTKKEHWMIATKSRYSWELTWSQPHLPRMQILPQVPLMKSENALEAWTVLKSGDYNYGTCSGHILLTYENLTVENSSTLN